MKQYYVYILASLSRRLYVGSTDNLVIRLWKHRNALFGAKAHSAKYRTFRLVYYETLGDRHAAFVREREIKGWSRTRKIALIESVNAGWLDLSIDWPTAGPPSSPRPGAH